MSRVITGSDGRKYLTDEPLLHPPQREWVGMTDDEIDDLISYPWGAAKDWVKAIEAKLKERNL
jgi:hypothetical protein